MLAFNPAHLLVCLVALVVKCPQQTSGAGIQAQPEPSKFVEHKIHLYDGNSVSEFLRLCVQPTDHCPFHGKKDLDLVAAQRKTLLNGQARVKGLLNSFKSPLRNAIRLGILAVCIGLSIYVVVLKKHIDFRLFSKEWVFDGSYGFHAKILKRMVFELLPMTKEEFAAMKHAKREAVKKRREQREEASEERLFGRETPKSSSSKKDKVKTKLDILKEEILASSKKQRVLRKKYQLMFDEAKRKYMLDERKKFRNEQAIINAEVRRLENETKDEYHKKLLGRFKNDPTPVPEQVAELEALLQEPVKEKVEVKVEKPKPRKASLESLKITNKTVPTMGLMDIRRDETGSFRDLDEPVQKQASISKLKLKARVKFNDEPKVTSSDDLRKMEVTKTRKKPRQVFNKITQRYDDVEEDDDDD